MRKEYQLTEDEMFELKKFRGHRWLTAYSVWQFWQDVADRRGIDYGSILSVSGKEPRSFSALPKGHTNAWCFPSRLKCNKPPSKFDLAVP
jgi:hypothetical protein